jgi:hypothetical protein
MPIATLLRDEHKSQLLFHHLSLRNDLLPHPRAFSREFWIGKGTKYFWSSSSRIIS